MQIKKYCCGAGTLFKIVNSFTRKLHSWRVCLQKHRTKKSGAIMLLTYPSGHTVVVVNVSLMCVQDGRREGSVEGGLRTWHRAQPTLISVIRVCFTSPLINWNAARQSKGVAEKTKHIHPPPPPQNKTWHQTGLSRLSLLVSAQRIPDVTHVTLQIPTLTG